MSGEELNRALDLQASVNQRVYERSQEVLSEKQLQAFGQFQTDQLQMMRIGMAMARNLMLPVESKATAHPPQ